MNVMDCVIAMTEVEEEDSMEVDEAVDKKTKDYENAKVAPSDDSSREADSPHSVLTVEKVLETFKRISSIKTPDINSKLAIPFKKQPAVSRTKFKEEYSDIKSDLRKVSGGLGKEAYHTEKERRKSQPFPWPKASPPPPALGRDHTCFFYLVRKLDLEENSF